ncbi:MAG: maleylpyruvate isomerase family mycothiol-dependent enzyme [Nocardioidaceae bacterium]|nr:maleylpyruvate isomerase family mycothiol-dependent enzyme [Nocardioidaceae bacterium]
MSDLWDAVAAERGALAADLAGLSEEQWRTPSLCQGWSVRDVLAHMTATAHLSPAGFLGSFASSGFNFERFANKNIRKRLGADPEATLAGFAEVQHSRTAPPGPTASWLGEAIVHAEDIRRPLGLQHTYDPESVRRVADFYKGSNTLIGTKNRIAGLSLRATDTDWSHGEGAEVSGPMLPLLMAMTGRRSPCGDLSGPGLETLRKRTR